MPSHQVLYSVAQLTPPHKRRRKRNQGSNQSFSRFDFTNSTSNSSNSNNNISSGGNPSFSIFRNFHQISKNGTTVEETNDDSYWIGQPASLKRCSIHETNSMANTIVAPTQQDEDGNKTRVRSISNPLPFISKGSNKPKDSESNNSSSSTAVLSVSLSSSTKNLSTTTTTRTTTLGSNNKQLMGSSALIIPTISVTTTTTTTQQQPTAPSSLILNNNLSTKGNNILTRLLRKSKESKMAKKHHHHSTTTITTNILTKSSSNQHLTVEVASSLISLSPKDNKTNSSSFKSFGSAATSVSALDTNHSLSNISSCSNESNVIPHCNETDCTGSCSSDNVGNNTNGSAGDNANEEVVLDKEGDKNNSLGDEQPKFNHDEKMTANATCCRIDAPSSTTTTIICKITEEDSPVIESSPCPSNNLKFIRRLSITMSQQLSSSQQQSKRQKIRNSNLSDCPQEIILHIASFILCTTSHTSSLFAEFSLSPSGGGNNNMIGSFSPSSITPPIDSSNSTISRRNSSSIMRRIGHYPKYTLFPAELTRDYFNLMLISQSFHSALEFDAENEDQFKNSIVEGFWKYMLLWQYVYPNFSTIDKLEEYMRDLEIRKSLNISYKRLYSYVNTQSLQQKVVIPKKKNVVYDPSNYFYLLVAGVNFLVVQTIRALFFESKNDFECRSIKFNKEEFKVKVESCSFMDYSLAPNSAEYKFRGTDGVLFVAYMSSRSSLDAMIKYIEKCIEFRKKDEQRTTMDPPAAIILGTITKNTTVHEISLNDLLLVKKTYSYFIKDVIIVNTDTMENIQSSFEKISTMMYRSRVKSYVKTLPIIDEALNKDDATISQELKRRKSKRHIPSRNKKCTIM